MILITSSTGFIGDNFFLDCLSNPSDGGVINPTSKVDITDGLLRTITFLKKIIK